MMNLDSSWKLH